jgi:hypothetical protein
VWAAGTLRPGFPAAGVAPPPPPPPPPAHVHQPPGALASVMSMSQQLTTRHLALHTSHLKALHGCRLSHPCTQLPHMHLRRRGFQQEGHVCMQIGHGYCYVGPGL